MVKGWLGHSKAELAAWTVVCGVFSFPFLIFLPAPFTCRATCWSLPLPAPCTCRAACRSLLTAALPSLPAPPASSPPACPPHMQGNMFEPAYSSLVQLPVGVHQ